MKFATINLTLTPSYLRKNTLMLALICSLLLHIITSYYLKINTSPVAKPNTLVVELIQQQQPPPPPPVALPEPPKVEPVKPKIVSKPIPKPILLPTETKNEPALPPPPTEVIAIESKPETPPSPMPPAPIVVAEPPKPLAPPDTSAAREIYGNALWGAIGKHKQYPRIAQMRGWQGETILELQLDVNGKLKSKKIIQSSGYDALDKQALEMVEKAMPLPAPPEALRGSIIRVPIPFKLE